MREGPAVETLQLPPALAVDDVPHIDKGAGLLGTQVVKRGRSELDMPGPKGLQGLHING